MSGRSDTLYLDTICGPISNLDNVWHYLERPPKWASETIDIVPRSQLVVKNEVGDCHTKFEDFSSRVRFERHSVPRTLVCHDMRGGYLEDRFIGAINIGNCYSFYRWSQIDVFVYFSHHLITIPPLAWINIAHKNGVKILGTFITEFEPGERVCEEIFISDNKMREFVNVLVGICITFKLDGWLLNIENKFKNVALLKNFVDCLTRALHFRRPGSLVIWYDSVTCNGDLSWQNELNNSNKCFFDLCDGIFLNYTWNEESLSRTVKVAEHRRLDVYVGVDVFGRNFYGGGGFNTHLAVKKIRENNLSMAIFAQGWTHETLHKGSPDNNMNEQFLNRDNAFWRSLWPYLYTHPVNRAFQSFFYTGVDRFWCKLHAQDIQLSHCLHAESQLEEENVVPTLLDACSCLRLFIENSSYLCRVTTSNLERHYQYVHRLLSCDILVNGKLLFYYYLRSLNDHLSMVLLLSYSNGTLRKIICNSSHKDILVNNSSILELNPVQDQATLGEVTRKSLEAPSSWVLRCFSLQVYDAKILEVGARLDQNATAFLCGIGFIEF